MPGTEQSKTDNMLENMSEPGEQVRAVRSIVKQSWIEDALNDNPWDDAELNKLVDDDEVIDWLHDFADLKKLELTVVDDDFACLIGKSMGDAKVMIFDKANALIGQSASVRIKKLAREGIWHPTKLERVEGKVVITEEPEGTVSAGLKLHISFEFLSASGCIYLDWDCFLSDDNVIVITAPRKTCYDTELRLRSETGNAMESNEGYAEHYINGVFFNKDAFGKLMAGTMTAKEAIDLEDVEHRAIAMRMIGYAEVLKQLGARTLEKDDDYELVECDLHDDGDDVEDGNVPARFVKVKCPSTGKETLLRVDPDDDGTRTCMGAVAWTFALERENYRPEVEA